MTQTERTLTVYGRSSAPPEAVWAPLVDATAWSTWSRIPSAKREREGVPAPDGVGAIRQLGLGRIGSREEVVAFEPPHHFAYVLLTGMPVTDYRADVTLTADGTGTLITWSARFVPNWPGTGVALEQFFRTTLTGFARGLAKYASPEGFGVSRDPIRVPTDAKTSR
jgi:Polyketide cyclase / dehydrase and lipid transport